MTPDLKRLADAGVSWPEPTQTRCHDSGDKGNAWPHIVRVILMELVTMSDEMVAAVLDTEFPDDMSAQDQIRAMHKAMIASIMDKEDLKQEILRGSK